MGMGSVGFIICSGAGLEGGDDREAGEGESGKPDEPICKRDLNFRGATESTGV